MRNRIMLGAVVATVVAIAGAPLVQAQFLDQLKGAVTSGINNGISNGIGSATGSLTDTTTGRTPVTVPSLSQSGPGNTAGVLHYCIRNNYLGSANAGSVESALLNRVPGRNTDPLYENGARGQLTTGSGQSFDFATQESIKQGVTGKVCDLAVTHGKSFL